MDILPPPKKRPAESVSPPAADPAPATPVNTNKPSGNNRGPQAKPLVLKHPFYRKKQTWILALLGLFVVGATSLIIWYNLSIQPKSSSEQKVQFVVKEGEASVSIIDRLAANGLIRSKLATRLYVEMSGQKADLQAGGYILSPSQPVSDIITHIASGKTDEQLVTITPGRTLAEIREELKKFGYSDANIDDAYAAEYDHPLLADRPVGASLEGYIYPESFRVVAGMPLSELFERSFDEVYEKLRTDGLIEKFKARGLNLHQALTLASIVQREVPGADDQRQVSQVFYSRLAIDMVLGADATFEYAAEQLGVTPAVDIESPYNTRRNPGLPPGPIANMNYSALQAVADPAPGDFLYFVSGDDGNTYFARTFEEHEANIAAHCHDLCNLY